MGTRTGIRTGTEPAPEPAPELAQNRHQHQNRHRTVTSIRTGTGTGRANAAAPAGTQPPKDARGHASPTHGLTGSDSSRQAGPVPGAAVLCHAVPCRATRPRARAGARCPLPATLTPRHGRAPRRPHRGRPCQLSSPCPPHPEGPPAPSSTSREGSRGPLAAVGPSTSGPGPRLAAISQHPAASAAPGPHLSQLERRQRRPRSLPAPEHQCLPRSVAPSTAAPPAPAPLPPPAPTLPPPPCHVTPAGTEGTLPPPPCHVTPAGTEGTLPPPLPPSPRRHRGDALAAPNRARAGERWPGGRGAAAGVPFPARRGIALLPPARPRGCSTRVREPRPSPRHARSAPAALRHRRAPPAPPAPPCRPAGRRGAAGTGPGGHRVRRRAPVRCGAAPAGQGGAAEALPFGTEKGYCMTRDGDASARPPRPCRSLGKARRVRARLSRRGRGRAGRALLARTERSGLGAVSERVSEQSRVSFASSASLPAGLSPRCRFPLSESGAGVSSRPLLREVETKPTGKPSQKRAEN
ncbi:translation initiation factor IF-2-like [Melozone crissalis]|uniref:translation initiation factor IF-2-like n=1 Tax=Melozone crissalis TaxID=40204 RepID=UPI0023DB112A|nr:translation initiation factor IF-2-like [Melozone crissalis]